MGSRIITKKRQRVKRWIMADDLFGKCLAKRIPQNNSFYRVFKK